MSALTNAAENKLTLLLFNNTTWANIGDVTGIVGSTTAGSLYISLHTSSPGETGDQTTNEATFSSYARVAVARTSGGWTVSSDTASNTAAITFPACDGGTNTITHFGIGTASTLAGNLIAYGTLTSSLAVSNGITVQFNAGQLTITAA